MMKFSVSDQPIITRFTTVVMQASSIRYRHIIHLKWQNYRPHFKDKIIEVLIIVTLVIKIKKKKRGKKTKWILKKKQIEILIIWSKNLIGLFFSDPLPRTVLLAFRARRNLVCNTQNSGVYSVIRQADRAGRLLRESLKLSYNKENTEIVQVCFILAFRHSLFFFLAFFAMYIIWKQIEVTRCDMNEETRQTEVLDIWVVWRLWWSGFLTRRSSQHDFMETKLLQLCIVVALHFISVCNALAVQ